MPIIKYDIENIFIILESKALDISNNLSVLVTGIITVHGRGEGYNN